MRDPSKPETWPKEYSFFHVMVEHVFKLCRFTVIDTPIFMKPSKPRPCFIVPYSGGLIDVDENTIAYPCTPEGWIFPKDGLPEYDKEVLALYQPETCEPFLVIARRNAPDVWQIMRGKLRVPGRVIVGWMPGPQVPGESK